MTLTARYVPVTHLQGDSKLVRFDFFTGTTATARPMTGYEFTAQIRARPGASQVLANLTVDDSNVDLGIIVLELDAASSDELKVGSYHWDVQWVYLGRPFTFALGEWTVEGQVTR